MDVDGESCAHVDVAGDAVRIIGRGAAVLGLFLAGCGPTDQEIGVAVLTSLALIVPIGAGLNYALYRLWRGTRELHAARGAEAAAACLATLALAMAVNVFVLPADDGELVLVAFWIIGTTYLTYFSLAIGLALALSRRWAFRVLYWLPAVLIALLALPMALFVGLDSEIVGPLMLTLIWSGAFGGVGGPLFAVLLGVSIYVFVRDRRRSRAQAPPLRF